MTFLQIANTSLNSPAVYDKLINNFGDWRALLVVLGFVLAMNIVIIVANWFSQMLLKKKEVRINRKIKIEEKRLALIEGIYLKLDELALVDHTKREEIIRLVAECKFSIRKGRLYIEKELENKLHEYLDYYLTVAVEWPKKDIKFENDKLGAIIKQVNG